MNNVSSLEFFTNLNNTSIPTPTAAPPDPEFLSKTFRAIPGKQTPMKTTKYEKEYDAFCHWTALPEELRNPKTLGQFERRWGIPKNYTAHFREREDYQSRRLKYFWNWYMELWPNLIYRAYQRAMKTSTADFKALSELVARNAEAVAPKMAVTPLVILNVAPEKTEKLFEPKQVAPVKQAQIVKEE